MTAVAIACALLGAVCLAVGTFLQGSSVQKNHGHDGVSLAGVISMFKEPRWVGGLLCMGTGTVANLVALTLAPLIIVQPIGAIAVVITAFINTKAIGAKFNKEAIIAIMSCIIGSGAFVLGALHVSHQGTITYQEQHVTLIMLVIVVVIIAGLLLFAKDKVPPFSYIIFAGVLFGFVAVMTRTVLTQLFDTDGILKLENVDYTMLVALIITGLFGSWIVQNAYSKQPPDMVSAGLTVVDPIVGITIGITILHELNDHVNLWIGAGMLAAAFLAISGVVALSKFHPEHSLPGKITNPENQSIEL
ncbi:MAG: DMT family transporter [Micrococcaceae bacterium]